MGFSARWCLNLLPAVIASIAFATGMLYSFGCQSIQFVADGSDGPNLRYGPWYQMETVTSSTQVGQYTQVSVVDACTNYPPGTYVDPYLKTVRAFSMMAAIIGGLLTFGLWLSPCLFRFGEGSWKSLATVFLVLLPLFQGFTFFLYPSSFCTDNPILASEGLSSAYSSECQWDGGSTANAFSVALWFLTGVTMIVIGCPKRPARPPAETQTVTYQQTTDPVDGTKTVAEVAVVKGTAVPPPAPAEQFSMAPPEKAEEA